MRTHNAPSGSRPAQKNSKPSLWIDYFGIEPRKLLVVGAVVTGAAVLTTIPYVLYTGYDKWKNDMAAASDLMLAEFPAPAGASTPAGLAPGVGLDQRGSASRSVRSGRTRQYVCPACGTAASPNWTGGGQPACPSCGNRMTSLP